MGIDRVLGPLAGKIRPKMRYAHQGGSNPPVVIIHGNALEAVHASYWRYLEHFFIKTFKLQGTPLRVQFKKTDNPFEGKEAPNRGRRGPQSAKNALKKR